MTNKKFTNQQFLELYNKGLNDQQIAHLLKVNPNNVMRRRWQCGLLPNWRITSKTIMNPRKHYEKVEKQKYKYLKEVWKPNNPEKIREKNRKYLKKYPEKAKQFAQKYRDTHREQVREYHRKYYKEHPEQMKAKSKRYRTKYREQISKKAREKRARAKARREVRGANTDSILNR